MGRMPHLFSWVKMICAGVRLGDEFDEFFEGAGLVARSVQQGALERDVSCRYCWFLAGGMARKAGKFFSHKHYLDRGAVCEWRRSHDVQCKKRRRK